MVFANLVHAWLWHTGVLTPEQAVTAATILGARRLVPGAWVDRGQ
jgi:hypothetical protein